MKKGIAIILLTTYLVTTTGLGQLLNLPKLATHYFAHKKSDQDLNFWKYLAMHYNENKENDGDENEDRKLPFKTVNNAYFYSIATNEPVASVHVNHPLPLPKNILYYIVNTDFNQLLISRNIWHPPQFL